MEEKGGDKHFGLKPPLDMRPFSVITAATCYAIMFVGIFFWHAAQPLSQTGRPGSAALSSVAVNQPDRRRSVAAATVAIATSDAVVRNVVKSSAPEWKASTAAKRIHLGRLSLYGSGAIGRERCDAREIYA